MTKIETLQTGQIYKLKCLVRPDLRSEGCQQLDNACIVFIRDLDISEYDDIDDINEHPLVEVFCNNTIETLSTSIFEFHKVV
jgi:hypothetical protein